MALSLLLVVVALVTALAGMVYVPMAAGIIALVPLVLAIAELRRLIADSRDILREMATIAEKNEEVINSFSHKIREPLNNLVLLGNMLSETTASPKQQELGETFIASTGSMVEVVNELTMQTAGNITFERRGEIRFRLGPIIQDTIGLMKLNRRHDQSVVVYDDHGEGDSEYRGDPIILKQILIDLLSAAISGSAGRITIRIRCVKPGRGKDHRRGVHSDVKQPVVFIGEDASPIHLPQAYPRLWRKLAGGYCRYRIILCVLYLHAPG